MENEEPVVEGDLNENPDEMVGEEVEPEHDLDVDSFGEEDDENDDEETE